MHSGRALIADADEHHTGELKALITGAGWTVAVAKSLQDVGRAVEAEHFNLAILALDVGGESVETLFKSGALDDIDELIVMSEQDDPPRVRRVMRNGASYFFCKPYDEQFFRELIKDLSSEIARDQDPDGDEAVCPVDQFGAMRGSSRSMQRVFRILRKVAATDASVLLIGESGTGKELAAQTVHQLSNRASNALIAMNCGAIPAELVESELFGHVKGAFTGAEKRHVGYFERAHNATLFLDEITEMPPETQVKLLRVLETGQFRQVGGEKDMFSNVRIVAATNRDPQTALDEGALREDLYYRIASFPITIPPLRKRVGDISGLAQYFLEEHNLANTTQVSFTPAAVDALNAYDWPGNVRELKSAVERAYVMSPGVIDAEHLQLRAGGVNIEEGAIKRAGDRVTVSVGASIDDVERQLIMATLEELGGDKKATARTLGISLKTLYNRLNEYDA